MSGEQVRIAGGAGWGARAARFLAVFGPGLVVMLADTDVGSVITAGQSGVQWGYRLLLLQLVLMPILYMVQELTVRLGVFTGRGHGELIRETFGPVWAWVSAAGLGIATVGALLTEFSGVAGVGELYGVPRVGLAADRGRGAAGGGADRIVSAGRAGGHRHRPVRAGVLLRRLGRASGSARDCWRDRSTFRYANQDYLYLVAANIGAVIMPWMIFYQQSAIADKRLGRSIITAARWDTAIGAVITQLVMAAVLIACAATIGRGNAEAQSLHTVGRDEPGDDAVSGPARWASWCSASACWAPAWWPRSSPRWPWPGGWARWPATALAGAPSAGGALVLWRVRRSAWSAARSLVGFWPEPGLAERRRAGDERAAAAAGAGLPDRALGAGAAAAVPAARGLLVAGGGRRGADLRVGRVRRAVRRGIVLTAGGGWKARHPRSRTEKPLPWTCPWDVLLGRVLGTCPWDMPMGRVPRR